MSRRPSLAETIRTPEFAASVKRHRAKIDAEDEGWAVMEPRRARALEAVARAARRRQWSGEDIQGRVSCVFCNGALMDGHLPRCALARLRRVSGQGSTVKGADKSGRNSRGGAARRGR